MGKLTPKRIKYTKDYVSFWQEKGDYGKERVKRMLERKHKRAEKLVNNCPHCKKNRASRYPHTCPYQEEMSWDGSSSLCRCCGSCEYDCAMDV